MLATIMRFFRFENGALHECQFLDGDMMLRQEGGQLIVYVKARQRIFELLVKAKFSMVL